MEKPATSARSAISRSKSSSILTGSIARRLRWLPSVACVLVAGFVLPKQADAATLSWTGGTGDWLTGSNWTPAGPPGVGDSAIITNGGTAQLAGAGGTVADLEVGSTGSGTLQINAGGSLDGGAVFIGTVANVGPGSITVSGANAVLKMSQVSIGAAVSGSLTIANGGIVVQTNSIANDVTLGELPGGNGTLNLNAGGTLQVSGTNGIAIGSGSGTFNFAGGTLQVGIFGDLTTSVNMTLASATNSTVDTNGHNATLSGILSGSGALTKIGAGTLTLSGVNTYSGGTTLNAGTLIVSNASALGGATGGTLTINGGTMGDNVNNVILSNHVVINADFSTTRLNGASVLNFAGTVDLGGGNRTITNLNGGNTAFGQAISNGTGLTFATPLGGTASMFQFSGTNISNTYTGVTTVQGPTTLQLSRTGTSTSIPGDFVIQDSSIVFDNSSEQIADTSNVSMGGTSKLVLTNSATETIDSLYSASALTTVDLGTGTLIVNGTTGSLFEGNMITTSAGGTLVKKGATTMILTGTNTFQGGTTINAGTLQIGGAGTTGSIIGDVTNNASLVFNRSNAYTFAGNITGTGSVTQNGTGKLTLSGTGSNYSGGTNINAGVLSITNGSALGSGAVILAAGAELNAAATLTLANQLTSSATGNSTISAAAGTTLTLKTLAASTGNTIFGSAGNTGTVTVGPLTSAQAFFAGTMEVAYGTARNGGGGRERPRFYY